MVEGGREGLQSNDLRADQVITSWDAGWDVVCVLALVGNELVDTPGLAREAVLVDLEPLQAGWVGGLGGIWDLGEVGDDGALVGGVDGLGGAVAVVPFESD